MQHGGYLNKFNLPQDYEKGICRYFLIFRIIKAVKKLPLGILNNELLYNKWSQKGNALIINVSTQRYAIDPKSMALSGQILSTFHQFLNSIKI